MPGMMGLYPPVACFLHEGRTKAAVQEGGSKVRAGTVSRGTVSPCPLQNKVLLSRGGTGSLLVVCCRLLPPCPQPLGEAPGRRRGKAAGEIAGSVTMEEERVIRSKSYRSRDE